MDLTTSEVRVLGALIEKEITTPDIYPLSLNALLAAANQRSSREPVMDLTEEELRQALHGLEDRGLASPARAGLSSTGSRVTKYEHHARTVLQLRRDETALLCLLLLRGPQTPGELRSRADRLFAFDDLQAVVGALERLAMPAAGDEAAVALRPLIRVLPRQPGAREARYMHLLGVPAPAAAAVGVKAAVPGDLSLRVTALEDRVATLEGRLLELEGRASREGDAHPVEDDEEHLPS